MKKKDTMHHVTINQMEKKNGRPEEANFVKKQVSLRIQHFYLMLAGTLK
jgi:hypothetical protein